MLAVLCATAVAFVQDPLQADVFRGRVTKNVSYRYLVSLPDGYERSRERVPLILFLHGSGERGDDVQKVKVHGPLREIANGRKIAAVVIVPQCETRQSWDPDALSAFVTFLEKKYRLDRNRLYLTGLSMGGFGTWGLATANPGRFAAIAPVCGGGDAGEAAKLANIPIWVTHGDADPAVPIAESERMVDAVRKAGNSRVRFDVIKGGGHDVWTDFYAKDEFYSWLFSQRKGR